MTIHKTDDEVVDISGKEEIKELIAPNAEMVDARHCKNLRTLDAPNA